MQNRTKFHVRINFLTVMIVVYCGYSWNCHSDRSSENKYHEDNAIEALEEEKMDSVISIDSNQPNKAPRGFIDSNSISSEYFSFIKVDDSLNAILRALEAYPYKEKKTLEDQSDLYEVIRTYSIENQGDITLSFFFEYGRLNNASSKSSYYSYDGIGPGSTVADILLSGKSFHISREFPYENYYIKFDEIRNLVMEIYPAKSIKKIIIDFDERCEPLNEKNISEVIDPKKITIAKVYLTPNF